MLLLLFVCCVASAVCCSILNMSAILKAELIVGWMLPYYNQTCERMCERCRLPLFPGRTVARQGGRRCWQRATVRSLHEEGEATYWSSMFVAVHKAPIWTFPRQADKLFVFASVCLWAGQRQTAKRWKQMRYIRGRGTRGGTWFQPLLIIRLWLEGLYVYVDFINSLGIDSLRPDRCCHRLKGLFLQHGAFYS